MQPQDAVAISQEHHDALSHAVLAHDLAAFTARMAIPHCLTTMNGTLVISSYEQMAELFGTHADQLGSQGVTDFIRIVKKAEFLAPDCIVAEHESHVVRNGIRVATPYPSRTWLRLVDGAWRETHAANGVLNTAADFGRVIQTPTKPCIPDLPRDPMEEPAP